MKDWVAVFNAEAGVARPTIDEKALKFLAGGAVRFNSEQVHVHWTDHLSLLLAHNARANKKNLVIGVAGAPSTLGMLVVIRDTIMSIFSRWSAEGRIDSNRPPEKILWIAPKGDMSQIFRKAIFTANNQPVPLQEVANLVSLDLLGHHLPTTTIAFLRDSWRIGEALHAHTFTTIVVDDPFGQICGTPQGTAEILKRIFAAPNHPLVVAIVPVRALPEPGALDYIEPVISWPWTAEVGTPIAPDSFAQQQRANLAGTPIQRSQVVFDSARLLPATVVVCSPTQTKLTDAMEEVYAISARLAQEAHGSKNVTDHRLVGSARAAVLALESVAMPITFHEAPLGPTGKWQSLTITQRLDGIRSALFGCSKAIGDDLAILLDKVANLMTLMKTDVPKWGRLVALLTESHKKGLSTAVAVPNRRIQAAMVMALQVQFPEYRDQLPWEVVTSASIVRLGDVDELIFVGLPSTSQNWLLRYPVSADRKLMVWPFHTKLGIWLSAAPKLTGAEQVRLNAWEALSETPLGGAPDAVPAKVPQVAVIEDLTGTKVYYDIPHEADITPFLWSPSLPGEDENDEDAGAEEEPSPLAPPLQPEDAYIDHHYVIHLADGGIVYALEDDFLDVLKGTDLLMAAPASLVSGQELVLIRGQSYIKLRNRLMENVDRRYNSIWFEEDWTRWRQMCRTLPRKGAGFQAFLAQLREHKCDKDRQTVVTWIDGTVMAPLDLLDIRRMAACADDGMMVYFSARFAQGMSELRGRHSAFGRWLKRAILTKGPRNSYEPFEDPVLDFTGKDLANSVSRHPIKRIVQKDGRPPHRTGEVINSKEE